MKRFAFILLLAYCIPLLAADTKYPVTYYRAVDSLRTNLVADSLYRYADYDQQMKHWERADTLAQKGLATLDTLQNLLDWTYRGSDEAIAAAMLGMRVAVITRPMGKPELNRIEFHNPATDELLIVYDPAPWLVDETIGFVQTDKNTTIFETWPKVDGYRVTTFSHSRLDGGFQVIREGRTIIRALPDKRDRIWLLEYDADQTVHLVLYNADSKRFAQVKTFHEYSPLAFKPPSRAYNDGWVLIDMDELYFLDPLAGRCDKLMNLPFIAVSEDQFSGWTFSAMRDNDLHLLKFKPRPPVYKHVILPDAIPAERNGLSAKVNDFGAYLANVQDDSLSLYNILGDEASLESRHSALRRHGFMLLDGLEWFGHLLLHYGRNGLRVYNGSNLIFADSANGDQVGVIEPLEGMLWAHRAPDFLYCVDLNTKDTLWHSSLKLSPARHMARLNDGWLALNNNYLDYRVVDFANGNELLRQPVPGPMVFSYLPLDESVLLNGPGGAFLRYLPIRRDLRADLVELRARGLNVLGDTTQALDLATQAFILGEPLKEWAHNGLLKRYKGQRLTRESLQFVGQAAIRTGDPGWTKILNRGGAEFFSPAVLSGFNHLIPTGKGVMAMPSLTPKDYLTGEYGWHASFVLGPKFDSYGELQQRFLTSYAIQIPDGYILFSFERRSQNRPVYDGLAWLLNSSGSIKPLGKLDIAALSEQFPPSSDMVAGGIVPTLSNPDGDKILVNFWRFGFSEDVHPLFTACIDLTGGGKNWTDTTSVSPVFAGGQWYAHEISGEEIVYVAPHGQAARADMRTGDIIRSVNGYPVMACQRYSDLIATLPRGATYTVQVESPKGEQYTAELVKSYTGFESLPEQTLVELNQKNATHSNPMKLPAGYLLMAANEDGHLVYKYQDSLLFVDPVAQSMQRVTLPGISDTDLLTSPGMYDIAVFGNPSAGRFLGINLAASAVDSQRVVWRKTFGPLRNLPPLNEAADRFPVLLNDGTLLLINPVDGAEVNRTQLPFAAWIDRTALLGNTFYGSIEGRILGWNIASGSAASPVLFLLIGAGGMLALCLVGMVLMRKRG